MLETVGWGEKELREFTQAAGLPHSFLGKANTKYDMALLGTPAPFGVINIQEGFWHTVVQATYRITSIGDLTGFLAHLNPRDPNARLQEVRRLIELTRSFPHTVLMGDFNSLSPHDPYDHQALLKLLHEQGIAKFGIETLQFDCIKFIESQGFIDVMRALQKPFTPTVPTPANDDKMHAAPLRLDYVFISAGLRPFLRQATTVTTPLADIASDHYPVLADFDLVP